MSHIHIPDGVLPFWLWASGWLLTLAAVAIAGKIAERRDTRRKVALLGVVSSLMLVAMSSEIVPIAYHINLTVLGGVLLGPALSIIAAFVIEVVLAMLGHGGVTVLGLNTVLVALEMLLGWALFGGLVRLAGRKRAALAAGVATLLTLAITTTALVGIVSAAGTSSATARETGALDPASLKFENPFAGGVFSVGLFSGGEEPDGATAPDGGTASHANDGLALSVGRFAAVVYTLGPIGWLIEALVTAALVRYISRMRPALIFEGGLADTTRAIPGDHSGGL